MDSATSGTLQLNVRIPRESKEAGDAVLALMGSSPTKIVRALYEKLSRGAEAYEEVMVTLNSEDDSAECQIEENLRYQAFCRATHLMDDFAAEHGLDISTYVPLSDEEYEEALYEEYLEEIKGYVYD